MFHPAARLRHHAVRFAALAAVVATIATIAAVAAGVAPWPAPAPPPPVHGLLQGEALRDYIIDSARYRIANPQLLDRSPTLLGRLDDHGLRTDIAGWIQTLPMNDAQKAAIAQYGHAVQGALTVNVSDTRALQAADQAGQDAIDCLFKIIPHTFLGHEFADAIDFMFANTPLRQQAYMAYNDAPRPFDPPSIGSGIGCHGA